jgi:hypothetical protein
MKFALIVLAVFVAGSMAVDPALARAKYRAKPPCIDRPANFSVGDWLFSVRPHPQWNGCAPPVYSNGEYIGQDPDPNIRATLQRDPDEGYRIRR